MTSSRLAFYFLVLSVVLGLLGACGTAAPPGLEAVDAMTPTPGAVATLTTEDGLPGESYAALASDGAWSWFGGPRAVFHEGDHRRTYAGFVTSTGDVTLVQFDHGTGEVVSAVVKEELQRDDNASPAILVRQDHRLMVFYCGHRGRWMFYRIASNAEDITSWGDLYGPAGYSSDYPGYTYPNATLLKGEGGKRYVFWRGSEYLPTFASSETGLDWSEPAVLIRDEGVRPYVKMVSDGESTIHFTFSEDHPTHAPSNSIRYVCYREGAFSRADGSVVGTLEDLPLSLDDADLVYDSEASGVRAWPWDIALDRSGRPVIAYASFPAEDDHRYRYARWDGTAWLDTEIAPAGAWFPTAAKGRKHFNPYYSGGVVLDPSDPSIVYLSRPVDGVFEIERWTTSDGGRTWLTEAVTRGSVFDNVRPVVPVGHVPDGPGLIWMNGTYVDYTDHSMSLRMK